MEQNASKKLWKTDNEILEVNVTETISNIKNDAGEVMTNPEDITEYFNNFFVNIGKSQQERSLKVIRIRSLNFDGRKDKTILQKKKNGKLYKKTVIEKHIAYRGN